LVEKGLLDIVKSSKYDERIIMFFIGQLYREMDKVTSKWLCWDKLFHTFVSKTKFYGSPGSKNVAQIFKVVLNNDEKFKDFQIKSAVAFLTSPQAYDLGGAQVFLRHMFDYSILPLAIQLRFIDILTYLYNLDSVKLGHENIGSYYTLADLAEKFKPDLKSEDPNQKRFAELLSLLFKQEFETTTMYDPSTPSLEF
jgi:hypothetical protein